LLKSCILFKMHVNMAHLPTQSLQLILQSERSLHLFLSPSFSLSLSLSFCLSLSPSLSLSLFYSLSHSLSFSLSITHSSPSLSFSLPLCLYISLSLSLAEGCRELQDAWCSTQGGLISFSRTILPIVVVDGGIYKNARKHKF
jgi:hypothetical protein